MLVVLLGDGGAPLDRTERLCSLNQVIEETGFKSRAGDRRKHKGFPGGSVVKNPPASAGDTGSIPESGRSPGGGNGSSRQHSCLGNPMDRGAWQTIVHGAANSCA